MKKSKIYIAGKVTGLDSAVVAENFYEADRLLRTHGFLSINPIEVVNDWQCDWQKAMRLTIAEMMKADALLMLPNWRNSKGAMMEYSIAKELEIPVFEESEWTELLKHHGKLPKENCNHQRVRTVVLDSNCGCETTQSRCLDCGTNLTYPETEC